MTSLSAILKSPAEYNDKKVLLEGMVSAYCPSLCDFTYKEGVESVMIYPKGFKIWQFDKKHKVRVSGIVQSGEERVFISALGVEEVFG